MKLVILCAALSVLLPRLEAQTLDASGMTLGQTLTLDVAGANPGSFLFYAFTLTGVGGGTCIAGTPVCLDILEPVAVIDTLVADGAGASSWSTVMPAMAPPVTFWFQVVGADFTGGLLTVTKSNVVARTIQPLSALGDGFDGPGLDPSWATHNPSLMQLNVAGGQLVFEPTLGGGQDFWFLDGEGPALFKRIRGDFTAETSLLVEDPANPGQAPPLSYRLGGLIARDPGGVSGNRNSVHVALGSGTPAVPIAAEDKTTMQSMSAFSLHPVATSDGHLRLRRAGAVFTMWHRPVGAATWTLLATHVRSDLPAELDVGPMAYSSALTPAIRVLFDSVHFSAP